jgi:hypothetical protein
MDLAIFGVAKATDVGGRGKIEILAIDRTLEWRKILTLPF